MSDLSYDELRARLAAQCGRRNWPLPSRRRLQKLRDADRLPPAIRVAANGRSSWRYPSSTVARYLRTEELRRASGKRVRSWKLAATREQTQILRDWIARPNRRVPRDIFASVFEGFSLLFSTIAPELYPFLEQPVVGALDEEREKRAHDAIDDVLRKLGLDIETELGAGVDAFLRMLIFRDEKGNVDDTELADDLAPILDKVEPFANKMNGADGIRRAVQETPINALLTRPRALLESLGDEELRVSIRITADLAAACVRLGTVADVFMANVEKASSAGLGDVRVDWLKPLVKCAAWIARFMHSEEAPWLLCAFALVNVALIRRDPGIQTGVASWTASIVDLSAAVEQSRDAEQAMTRKRKRRAGTVRAAQSKPARRRKT